MYPVGHIAGGYVLAWLVTRGTGRSLSLWLVLTVGLLPDFDLLFGSFGLVHETVTHSIAVLVPLTVILVALRRGTLPYVAALLLHPVGDALLGVFSLLFPLSSLQAGLGLGMSSMADAVLEFSSLCVMLGVMWRWGDLRRMLSGARGNILMVVPLSSMVGLMWFSENGVDAPLVEGIVRLIDYGFSEEALTVITVGHLVLGAIMATSMALAIWSVIVRVEGRGWVVPSGYRRTVILTHVSRVLDSGSLVGSLSELVVDRP